MPQIRHRYLIEKTFGERALRQPLFYQYPGGIRFELSEGGSAVSMFLGAMGKALPICESIFENTEFCTVVLSARVWKNKFGYRDELRSLRRAGITISSDRSVWIESDVETEEEIEDNLWIRVCFELPKKYLPNLLWCALSRDLGIKPSPSVEVFLVNLESRLLVLPYDDRGMDVVGSNHDHLSILYRKFHRYILEYDKDQMEATFGVSEQSAHEESQLPISQ